MIGGAIGTAVAGALFGPPLGALATEIGTEPVFGSVLVVDRWCSRPPRRACPTRRSRQRGQPRARCCAPLRQRGRCLAPPALVAVPSLMFGAIAVLVPLRVDDLGGGARR